MSGRVGRGEVEGTVEGTLEGTVEATVRVLAKKQHPFKKGEFII